MTKQDILNIVKSMLVDWQDSEKFNNGEVMYSNCTSLGFCAWLDVNVPFRVKRMVISELEKEIKGIIRKLFLKNNDFWYPVYASDALFSSSGDKAFKNRINHLQRTIKRLETEIANEA